MSCYVLHVHIGMAVSRVDAIKSWLTQAGATQIRQTGVNNLVSTCPYHKDDHPSFSIQTENGLFLCFAAGCGVSGNLMVFLMTALKWSYPRALDALNTLDIPSLLDPDVFKLPPFERRKVSLEVPNAKIREGHLGLYRFCPQYMVDRGYPKSFLKEWEIGYDYGTNRVTIPVRDVNRKLMGMTKRSTYDDRPPKYLHLGFKKSQHLYGQFRDPEATECIVVEGQVDVLAFYLLRERLKLPPALIVSTMGSRVSWRQIEALARYERVYLAFDNDEDGLSATHKVGEGLSLRMRPDKVLVLRKFPVSCKDVGDIYEKDMKKSARVFCTDAETYMTVRLEQLDRKRY